MEVKWGNLNDGYKHMTNAPEGFVVSCKVLGETCELTIFRDKLCIYYVKIEEHLVDATVEWLVFKV